MAQHKPETLKLCEFADAVRGLLGLESLYLPRRRKTDEERFYVEPYRTQSERAPTYPQA